jgi:hypothetical protein
VARRGAERRGEWGEASERDIDVACARELQNRQRVRRRARRFDVSRGAGRGNELDVRRGHCIEQRDAVVDTGVDVHDHGQTFLGHGERRERRRFSRATSC